MAAAPERRRIRRFTRTDRIAHWLLAACFFAMVASGLALLSPSLAGVVDRPLAKDAHLLAAIALVGGLVLVIAGGDRRGLRRTMRDLDRFDADDRRWLDGAPRRIVAPATPAPPQGRFNAGQKLNAAFTGGFLVALYVTGALLWYGERDNEWRFAGTVGAHDWLSIAVVVLVAGHLYKAVIAPATRHSLRGMVTGEVDREWARRHHARWVAAEEAAEGDDGDAALTAGDRGGRPRDRAGEPAP